MAFGFPIYIYIYILLTVSLTSILQAMQLGFMCQAHRVPVAYQAPKGTRESRGMSIPDSQVPMGMMVIQGPVGIQAHLDLLKTEVCVNVFF